MQTLSRQRKFLSFVSLPLIWVLALPPSLYAYPDSHLRTGATARDSGTRKALERDLGTTPQRAFDGSPRNLQVGELTLKTGTIPDLLDMQVEKYGDRTYLLVPAAQGYQEVSFKEVGERAKHIAKALYAHGVRQGDKVGFLSPNRPDFGISTYSVLKLGGVVVPMPFGAPLPALEHMVSNSDTTFLVVAAPFLEKARTLKANTPSIQKIFVLDNISGLREDEISLAAWKEETPVTLPEVKISPENVALILYTSGSTKLPKGVPLTHQNLLYNMEASRLAWEKSFTDKDMTLGWLPFFHVMGLPHEFWKNMYVGTRYAFPRFKPGAPTPDQLIAALKESDATVIYTAPYMLEGFKAMAEGEVWEAVVGGQRMVMKFEKNPAVLETLRKLKFIMSGGVALTEQLGDYFKKNGVNVIQGEGMSDVGGAIFLSDPEEKDPHTLRLIPGMNAKFIPVEGVEGMELVLDHSPTTTAGYLKNLEETAETFQKDGFHTGDLFKEMRPGRYLFVGRTDDVDKTSKAEKIVKVQIERDLEKSPVIRRVALIVSQKPRPAAIVQPDYSALRGKQGAEIERAIWGEVEKVNAELPGFSRIRRDHLIILAPGEGLPLSPKQSLIRPQVEKLYADRIEEVYTRDARRVETQEKREALFEKTRRRTRGYRDIVKRTEHRDLTFALVEEARRLKEGRGRTKNVVLRGEGMTIPEEVVVAREDVPVRLSASRKVRGRMQGSVDRLRELLEEGTHIYGVTTQFGASANIDVPWDQLRALQHELIRMESVGLGDDSPRQITRAAMAARLNQNARGDSAVRASVLEMIATLLNKNITPDVPETGTITASGDLAPNAHVVGVLLGRDDATARDPEGKQISAREALDHAGLKPVVLEPKEGLALINGTNFATGLAALNLYDANILALLVQAATAMSAEGMEGTTQDFAPFVHERRGDAGQIEAARNIRGLLEGSRLVRHELHGQPRGAASAHDPREVIQTYYHHRTAAQTIGPEIRTLLDAAEVITRELNASTDNPLIDPETGDVFQGGNFQGKNVARVMDNTRRALAEMAALIQRQHAQATNGRYNKGLPDNLAGADLSQHPDIGFKGTDIDMTGWLSRALSIVQPVTPFIQSAEGHNQTINSLAFFSAQLTQKEIAILQIMLAYRFYANAQEVDLRNIERSYREATAQAIQETLEATLPKVVQNSGEIMERAKASLVNQAKHERPFSYAYTASADFRSLFEKLSPEIHAVLAGDPKVVGETHVELTEDRKAIAGYPQLFQRTLAEKLRTALPQARERALQQGAGHLLGNTRPIYDFIRRDLGIGFNSAEADLAPGPQAKILLRAIQDGRIVEPLRDAFFPVSGAAEQFAKDGGNHVAPSGELRPIRKVAVVGGGQMGAAFAMTAALSGLSVTVRDMDQPALDRAKARIEEGITGALKRRKLNEAGAEALRKRITYTANLQEAVNGADVVFEAVFEDPNVKRALFAELDSLLGPDVVLLSNTSSISVDELAPARAAQEAMVGGMHLFDPVWSQKIIEVVHRDSADPRVTGQALAMARLLGKEPIRVKNSPGFAFNRLFVPLFNEMLRLYDEGISPETIDAAAEEVFGPGARLFWYTATNNPNRSQTALKTEYAAASQFARQFGNDFYAPAKVLKENLAKIEKREGLWEMRKDAPVDRSRFPEIQDRLRGVVFAMAGQLIDEEIVMEDRPHRVIDYGTGMIFGWRQGPFKMMNERGTALSYILVQQLRSRYATLTVPVSLQELSKRGGLWPLRYVHRTTEKGTGTIIIDRPEAMNALNGDVIRELREEFEVALADSNIHVIVIRGGGTKAFVSGADLKFFIENRTADRVENIVDFAREGQILFHKIETSLKPVIMYVNGFALGGGLEIALAGHALVGTPTALFGAPEVGVVGIAQGVGGTKRLPEKTSLPVAKWMILGGAMIKAEQAHQVGLVDIAPSETEAWLQRLQQRAEQGPLSIEEFRRDFIPDRDIDIPEWLSAFAHRRAEEIRADLTKRAAAGSKEAEGALKRFEAGAPLARERANTLINENTRREEVSDGILENELDGIRALFPTQDALIGLTTPLGQPRAFTGQDGGRKSRMPTEEEIGQAFDVFVESISEERGVTAKLVAPGLSAVKDSPVWQARLEIVSKLAKQFGVSFEKGEPEKFAAGKMSKRELIAFILGRRTVPDGGGKAARDGNDRITLELPRTKEELKTALQRLFPDAEIYFVTERPKGYPVKISVFNRLENSLDYFVDKITEVEISNKLTDPIETMREIVVELETNETIKYYQHSRNHSTVVINEVVALTKRQLHVWEIADKAYDGGGKAARDGAKRVVDAQAKVDSVIEYAKRMFNATEEEVFTVEGEGASNVREALLGQLQHDLQVLHRIDIEFSPEEIAQARQPNGIDQATLVRWVEEKIVARDGGADKSWFKEEVVVRETIPAADILSTYFGHLIPGLPGPYLFQMKNPQGGWQTLLAGPDLIKRGTLVRLIAWTEWGGTEATQDGGTKDAVLWGKLQQLKQTTAVPGGFDVIYNERPGWSGVLLIYENKEFRGQNNLPTLTITYPPGTSAEEIIRAVSNATEANLNYSNDRTISLGDEIKAPFIALAQENGISRAADGGAKVAQPTLGELKARLQEILDPTRRHHRFLEFTNKGNVTKDHPVHFVWPADTRDAGLIQIQVWDQLNDPIAIRDAILAEWQNPRHDLHRIGRHVSAFLVLERQTAGWTSQLEVPSAPSIAPFARPEIAALLKSFKPVSDARTPVGQIAPDLEKITKPGALLISESLLEDASLAERLKNWPKNVPVVLLSRSGKWQEMLDAMYTVSQGEQSLPRSTFFAIVTPTALFVNGKSAALPVGFNIDHAREVIELVELETENQIVAYAVEEALREGYQSALGRKAYGIVYDLSKEGSKQVSAGVNAFNQLLEYLALPQKDRKELMKLGVIEIMTPTDVEGRIGEYLRTYAETLRRL